MATPRNNRAKTPPRFRVLGVMLPGLLLFFALSLFFGIFFALSNQVNGIMAAATGLGNAPTPEELRLHEDALVASHRPDFRKAAEQSAVDLTAVALVAAIAAAYVYHLPLIRFFKTRRNGKTLPEAVRLKARRRVFNSPFVVAFATPSAIVLFGILRYISSPPDSAARLMVPIEAAVLALSTLFTYLWQRHRVQSIYLGQLFSQEELASRVPRFHRTHLQGDLVLMVSLSTLLPIVVIVLFLATGINMTNKVSGLSSDQLSLLFGGAGSGAVLAARGGPAASASAGPMIAPINVLDGLKAIGLDDPALPVILPFDVARIVVGLAIGLAIILVYVYFIARWTAFDILRPVELLRANMGRAKEGDLEALTPALASNELGDLTVGFNAMLKGIAERERIKGLFGQYLTKEISEAILDGRVKLGGARYVATVMFTDIRNFTAMSESLPPEEIFAFLNDYLRRMIDVIAARGGIIDKFLGDGILAVFGIPVENGSHAADALGAALDMRAALAEMNRERAAAGRPEIRIGIGMHTGELIAGNVGSERKLQYTVIGDTVNLASRIEGLNKDFGSYLLLSQETWEHLGEAKAGLSFEKVSGVQVRGKAGPVDLYRLA